MINIPIVIISFNNYKYVKNTIDQLENIDSKILSNIIIMDNNSSEANTINFLNTTKHKVIRNSENKGPWIERYEDFYDSLPNKFILTDPDLEFNSNLPQNFIEILSNLSDKFECHKIGFALDIKDFDQMYNTTYYNNQTIYDWEKQFWSNKIDDLNYELYNAEIDTTFCLINKQASHKSSKRIRIADNFTAKHIPWYKKNPFYNEYEKYIYGTNSYSTISKLFLTHIYNNYHIISKNDEKFLIDVSISKNINFWKNIYSTWEKETFTIFDKYLSKNKIFIDFGADIGAMSIYGSRKSKHVYSIENDILSVKDLSLNLSNNSNNNNYTIINRSFSINDVINSYNINPNDIALIKVDIKGEEEKILKGLYDLNNKHKIPLYIGIHYKIWKDSNLNRFPFLTQKHRNDINNNQLTYLLLNGTDIKTINSNSKLKNNSLSKLLKWIKSNFT